MAELLSDAAKAQLRRLIEARDKRDEDKAAAETSENEYREMEADVYETLSESSVKGKIKVDLGDPWGVVSFGTSETHYGQVVDQLDAVDYYKKQHMLSEISQPRFVMKEINSQVRRIIEEGGEMPPGITYRTVRRVPITRQKS